MELLLPNCDCEACLRRDVSVCRGMSHAQLRVLARGGLMKTYVAGDEVLNERQAAKYVFIIDEGTLMMTKLLGHGRRQVLALFGRGDFVGLTADSEYGYNLEALTPARVCRLPLNSFRRAILEFPALDRELLARASDALIDAREHIALLGRKSAVERVAAFILQIADRQALDGGSPEVVFLPMTRIQIADYLGLTLETVSRTFSLLRRRRLIELLPRSSVRLLDRDKLTLIAEQA